MTRSRSVGMVLLALALLAGATDARPRPAAASSAVESGVPAALCPHGVPPDLCTKCDPDLADVFKAQGDWCDKHGLPQSQCRDCDPNVKIAAPAAPVDWCKEHAVPESKCPKCDPSRVATLIAAGDYCREHGFPASLCPLCHPELVTAAGHELPPVVEPGTLVRLASAATQSEAGIETTVIEGRSVARTLDVVGHLEFDRNLHATLSARSDAVVVEVRVDVGDEVAAGQPLVVLASSAVGAEQAQLGGARARIRTAERALERERGLAARGISARRSVEEAEQELAAARAEAGAASAALGVAGSAMGEAGRYALTAPFKGSVVARAVTPGKTVAAGETLIEVADLGVIWAELDIPEAQAGDVRRGQPVTITLEGGASAARCEELAGTIARVGAMVEAATRTVSARVELPNPGGHLKAGTFVRAVVTLGEPHQALVVPRASIQRTQGKALVFVKKSDTVYQPVAVEVGTAVGDAVEVTSADLTAGAEVVTTGAFLLKTEILKDSIGAGCCEVGGGEEK